MKILIVFIAIWCFSPIASAVICKFSWSPNPENQQIIGYNLYLWDTKIISAIKGISVEIDPCRRGRYSLTASSQTMESALSKPIYFLKVTAPSEFELLF